MIYMTKVRLEKESVFGIFDCPDAATVRPQTRSLNDASSGFEFVQQSVHVAAI